MYYTRVGESTPRPRVVRIRGMEIQAAGTVPLSGVRGDRGEPVAPWGSLCGELQRLGNRVGGLRDVLGGSFNRGAVCFLRPAGNVPG